MYWQREVLRSGVAMTFAQTHELDLPKSGLLGSLVCYIRSSQNGYPFLTSVVKWRLIDYISKIEVIADGAEIIKSYDGRQAIACAYHDDGVVPPGMWRTYSNTPHRQWIPLHFGRRLLDKKHCLDLSQFNQTTLKITNDATSTQFSTNIQLDVIAYWLREATVAPRGYYREEEWKKWNPVAAGWEYNDLPTALPIRRILLRARPGVVSTTSKNASSMHALMSDIEFNLRTGQNRVYRGSLEDLGFLSVLEQGRYAETFTHIDRNDELGYEVGIGYVQGSVKAPSTYTDTITVFPITIGAADVQDSKQEIKSRAADSPLEGHFRGHGFGHNVPLFDSAEDDDSDLLDPERDKTIQVNAMCASGTTVAGTEAAAESAIILSRLVR